MLTPEEKRERKRHRMIEKAREYSLGTYSRKFVAPVFQRMIRAEAAALPAGNSPTVIDGKVYECRHRNVGQCMCVTCGKVGPWKGNSVGGGPIETGHFLASRRASILYEETNLHPQCKHCNQHLSGNQANYEIWMQYVYGAEEVERLRRRKAETVQWTREELVDMRMQFQERLKAAEERMNL